MERDTIIGILFCITGNILISLGLNYQKVSSYLRSTKWWFGLALTSIGELQNFIAYGYLKIVTVSSMGIITLISNIVIAPIFFDQSLRPMRDIMGTIIASIGVVLIILSNMSDTEDEISDPVRYFYDTVFSFRFAIYSMVNCIIMAGLLVTANHHHHQLHHSTGAMIQHLIIVAILGSFTVISTKLLSILIRESSFSFQSIIIPTIQLITVIVITSYLQIKYLNKALKLNSSTVVIPLHYIFFNLSIIMSSFFVFKEFSHTSNIQVIMFGIGLVFAFIGVMLLSGYHHTSSIYEAVEQQEEDREDDIMIAEESEGESEDQSVDTTPPLVINSASGILQKARSTSHLFLEPINSLTGIQRPSNHAHSQGQGQGHSQVHGHGHGHRRVSEPSQTEQVSSYGSIVIGSGLIVNTVLNYNNTVDTSINDINVLRGA